MSALIESNLNYIIVGLVALLILSYILIIFLFTKIQKLNNKYKTFMNGNTGQDLEQVIFTRFAEIDTLKKIAKKHDKQLNDLHEDFTGCFSKMGLVKYDAFKEMGGTLSFALALLNDKNNGYIINSMHSREGCYTYSKEIINGQSYIVLSDEEKEALTNAINSKSSSPVISFLSIVVHPLLNKLSISLSSFTFIIDSILLFNNSEYFSMLLPSLVISLKYS